MRKVKPTQRQVLQRNLLKEANAYALSILRNPSQREAFVKTLQLGESVYHKAKKQYFARLKKENGFQ